MIVAGAFLDPRLFGLPLGLIEIILDLPAPPSTNDIWRSGRGRVYRSREYLAWQKNADAAVWERRQRPKDKIKGQFEICISLSESVRGDGDNRIKPLLDYLQSREFIRNDKDCRKGSWEFVQPAMAPLGCCVRLRSLHGRAT